MAIDWSVGVSLPTPTADAAATVGSDGATYLLGGSTTGVRRLFPGETVWSAGLTSDKQRVTPGAAAIADGRIMLFGGISGGQAIEETFFYDFDVSDNQEDGPSMNSTRARMGYAADDAGYLYALGGVDDNGGHLSSAESFDSASGTWTAIAPLPTARSEFAAVYDNGHLYTFGGTVAGYGSGNVSTTVYDYSIEDNTWSVKASLPKALRSMSAAVYDGTVYVMGGIAGSGTVADVYAYDILSNSWTRETDLPAPVSRASAVFTSDGTLMVIGGVGSSGATLATIYHSQDLTSDDSDPTFSSSPVISATATALYTYQVTAYGSPQPAFSLLAAPEGMQVGADGLITWTPTAGQVGSQQVIVQASNRSGSVNQEFVITVAAAYPEISSTAPVIGYTARPYTYDLDATGYPVPTFSIANGPATMTINGTSGVVSWTPASNDFGVHEVTVAAENANGRDEQSFTIHVADTIAPTAPTLLKSEFTGTSNVILSWQPSTDNAAVAGYRVYKQYKYGWRNSKTGYQLIVDNISSMATTLSGLTPGTNYKYVVRAFDAAGNVSLNSNILSITTFKAPSIYFVNGTVNGAVSASAQHAIPTFTVYASGIPTPTLSLVSAPAGLTFNTTTGAVNWTPTDAQVGTHTATFRATNTVGSANVTATITVKPNLPVIASTFTYFGRTYTTPFAIAGDPFELALRDTFSGAPVTWSVVTGPAGMTVDPGSGMVTWTPTAAQIGTASMQVRATNYAGSTDLSLSFTVHPVGTDLRPPAAVNGTVVSNIDLYSAEVTWNPTTDNIAVAGYEIRASYTYVRRGTHTVSKTFKVSATETAVHMTGLIGGKNYKVHVRAFDEAGNFSDVGAVIPFTTTANPKYPWLAYTRNNNYVIAGEPMSIQLRNTNTAVSASFSLVSGPAGMQVDSSTGLVTWTPSYADAGSVTMTFRASNEFGDRDVILTLPVYFTGAVQSLSYTRIAAAGTVSWTPPVDTSHIAGYFVYQFWSVNGHTYSRTYKVEDPFATSLSGLFLVGGPVSHSITVSAYDALGNIGVPRYPRASLV